MDYLFGTTLVIVLGLSYYYLLVKKGGIDDR